MNTRPPPLPGKNAVAIERKVVPEMAMQPDTVKEDKTRVHAEYKTYYQLLYRRHGKWLAHKTLFRRRAVCESCMIEYKYANAEDYMVAEYMLPV
jgi:hypothetical protein